MPKYILFNHDGSENHGCEALVRSMAKLLSKNSITLISKDPQQDLKYKVDLVVNDVVQSDVTAEVSKFSFRFLKGYLNLKLKNDYLPLDYCGKCEAVKAQKNDVAISIGGDCYCYGGENEIIEKDKCWRYMGLKTVLWGVSIEPELLKNEKIAKDIAEFDLITARETISYEALKELNPNTFLVSDSAFSLDKIELPLPCDDCDFVGINSSPLVENLEIEKGMARENFKQLIDYILKNTEMKILLIPHVIWNDCDDRTVLRELYKKFKSTGRVFLIDDCNCEELKGYISRCRFFVGARTHATIAAYSTCVPTLVVGYSVKAKGIAQDLFGSDEHYVLPVQSLKNADELKKAFQWLVFNEEEIKEKLESIMPEYIRRVDLGVEKLLNI